MIMTISIYINGQYAGKVTFNRSDFDRWPFRRSALQRLRTQRSGREVAWYFYV